MFSKKVERNFQIFEHINAINVTWVNVMYDDDVEVSRGKPLARSFCKTERSAFLSAVPDGVVYADLAGLIDEQAAETILT